MTTLYKNGELLTTQITSHRNLHVGFSITNFVTNNYWLHFGDYFHVKIQLWIRVFLPTGGTKPPLTGSGKPDRFDRLPEKNRPNSKSKPKTHVQPVPIG